MGVGLKVAETFMYNYTKLCMANQLLRNKKGNSESCEMN